MDPNPFHAYFHNVPVDIFCRVDGNNADIKYLTDNQTLEAAMKLLSDNKILGAPVTFNGEVIGIIDVLDIVQFVVKVAPNALDLKLNPTALETVGRAIAWKTVGEVVNESGRNPLVPIYASDPATSAISYFAQGFHRAVVFNSERQVIGVLSQTALVERMGEMLKHGDNKAIASRNLQSLGLGMAEPVTIKSSASVLDGLNALAGFNVSAIAIIDGSGKLCGNFSASDLRGIYAEHLPSFHKTIVEFLQEHSPQSLKPRAIYRDATLADCIDELQTEQVHRLWCIDGDFKPIGLVSNTDLMQLAQNFSNFVQKEAPK